MLCLCAWRPCSDRGAARAQACAACFVCVPGDHALSREQGSDALFVRLTTMPDRGAGERCAVWGPGDHALTGERRGRKPAPLALFECLGIMPDRGAGERCAVCVPGDHALTVKQESNALFVRLTTMPDRRAARA